jgi:GntR family transcriptional repressor for pyruvate dehydrogenase complex
MTGLTRLKGSHPGVPEIVRAVEEMIVSGRWDEGSRLPSERRLSDECAVSRPVVREALRVLSERGLIEISAGRGSFVRRLSAHSGAGNVELLARGGQVTARDLVVARTMLESEAASLAAQHRTDQDVARLRELFTRFDDSDVPEKADFDLAFHEAVALASHNPVIQVMFSSIRTLTHAVMLRSLVDRAVIAHAVPHDHILDAIIRQDADGARALMAEHIDTARNFYGDDLDRPLIEVLRSRLGSVPKLQEIMDQAEAPVVGVSS